MDTLIKNAVIITMSAAGEVIWDGYLEVKGDRIADVGRTANLEPDRESRADTVIDARGKALLPGFLNIHCHSPLLACRGRAEDVSNWDAIWGVMSSISAAMSPDDAYSMSLLAHVEMLKSGITTAVDSGTHMMRAGEAAVDSGIRAFLHQPFRDANVDKIREQGIYEYDPSTGDRELERAIDLVEKFHGRDDGRIQCLLGPHATDVCSPALLQKARKEANRLGVGVTIHLAQNELEPRQCLAKWGLRPGRMLEKAGFLGPDFIGAHGIFLNDEDIAVLSRNGCSVSHNPLINAKRAHIAPVPELTGAGVNVGLGTDNMFYDMFETLKAAHMVWRLRTQDPTQPDPEAILRMATINGASALGVEKNLGSLEAGKLADVIMVDLNRSRYTPLVQENLITNLVHFGLSSDVCTVMVGGRTLVDEFKYVGGDEQEILAEAQQVGSEVWTRAKADWARSMAQSSARRKRGTPER